MVIGSNEVYRGLCRAIAVFHLSCGGRHEYRRGSVYHVGRSDRDALRVQDGLLSHFTLRFSGLSVNRFPSAHFRAETVRCFLLT